MVLRNVALACMVLLIWHAPAATADERKAPSAEFLYQWNEVLYHGLYELNRFDRENRPLTSGDTPPRTSRAMAMVHGAMYDAVNGITGSYSPYRMQREETTPASPEAAAMQAAYVVLTGLFGQDGTELRGRGIETDIQNVINSRRSTQFLELLERVQAGELTREELEAGIAWGEKVGKAMLDWRAEDGSHIMVPYDDHVIAHGKYRMDTWTPDAQSKAAAPGWGSVKPFVIQNMDQFEVPSPPEIGSDEWNRDLEEVRRIGRRDRYDPQQYEDGKLPEEIDYQYRTAYFWAAKGLNADGGKNARGTLTPVGHWCRIADYVARERNLTLPEAARLYALLSVTEADVTIVAWRIKYDVDFWRPIHAIRWELEEGDPKSDWIPLIPTSMHPEYLSGHSTASGAASRVLAGFFGDDEITFTVGGDDAIENEQRTFFSFSAAAEEAGRSRIYGGIHYEFTNQHSLKLGREIGAHIFDNFFQPVTTRTATSE